jgi:preprotein translocase subunit SecE
MKKIKLFTDIEESYNELVYKVSWPTKSQLANSAVVVMVASILIAIVIFCMDEIIDQVMHFIYSL